MPYKHLPAVAVWLDEPTISQQPEVRACRKATKRALRALPPSPPSAEFLTQEAVQRRWIRAKCGRCRKCPEMVL